MKAVPMSFAEVYCKLEELGTEGARKILARHGAGEKQFGVAVGQLRALAKKLKTNHPLALELWNTGNTDAMLLATMVMEGAQLSKTEVQRMMQRLSYTKLVDEFVEKVIAKTLFADELRVAWMDSNEEFVGRAGWHLLIQKLTGAECDAAEIDLPQLVKRLEREILSAPTRKQETMNRCLVEIALRFPEMREECLRVGEALGHFDQRPVPKGCTSSYAPEWIAACLARKEKNDCKGVLNRESRSLKE